MTYPNYVTATLVQCNGTQCGGLSHLLGLIGGSSPLRFAAIAGEGVFASGYLIRVSLGGGLYTWELRVTYDGGGPCDGSRYFRLVQAVDDPVGEYGLWAGGVVDTEAGQATVAEAEL